MASVPEIQIEAMAVKEYSTKTFNGAINILCSSGWSVMSTACSCKCPDEDEPCGETLFCAILTRVIDNGNPSE